MWFQLFGAFRGRRARTPRKGSSPSLGRLRCYAWLATVLLSGSLPVSTAALAKDVTARFYGSSSFLFDDGKSQILIDGFFSRQRYSYLWGTFSPDLQQISDMVRHTGICVGGAARQPASKACRDGKRLRVIVPVHGHYDHALDAGVLALWSGADIVADPSIEAVLAASRHLSPEPFGLQHWNTPKRQIPFASPASHRHTLADTGEFEVTLLRGDHLRVFGLLLAKGVTDPELRFPASVRDFKVGTSFNVLIEHRGKRLLIVPSAGDLGNLLTDPPKRINTLFLGIGGLDINGHAATKRYWRQAIDSIRPKVVYLIHWDSDRPAFDFENPGFKMARKLTMRQTFRTIEAIKRADLPVLKPPALVPFDPFGP